jgi:type IV secretion system protein VirB8
VSAPADAYFAEARSWDADRVKQWRRLGRMAWCCAAVGWLCAVLGALTLMLLVPLKSVEPFVVRVDNTTGLVDVVPRYSGSAPLDESVTRYFLAHYVSTCERFNFATAESDYEECGAFHAAQRNTLWYAQWAPSNPASPLNVHKDGSSVRVQISAVTFFDRASGIKDLAQVRYVKALRAGPGAPESVSHWLASLQYAYGEPSKDPRLRRWNPLGFKVVDFRAEPEAVAPREGTDASAGKGP